MKIDIRPLIACLLSGWSGQKPTRLLWRNLFRTEKKSSGLYSSIESTGWIFASLSLADYSEGISELSRCWWVSSIFFDRLYLNTHHLQASIPIAWTSISNWQILTCPSFLNLFSHVSRPLDTNKQRTNEMTRLLINTEDPSPLSLTKRSSLAWRTVHSSSSRTIRNFAILNTGFPSV